MAHLYRQRIAALHESLQDQSVIAEAAAILRPLVESITLVPEAGTLAIVLRGDLAAMLRLATAKQNPAALQEFEALDRLLGPASKAVVAQRPNAKTPAFSGAGVLQGSLVAGARNTRFLRLVERHIPRLAA
ncbi:hypothetical protein GCM10007874_08490 [Labrys miyagiensis]|uniref:Uncharacterized protein n=2 Tax=Labrys miyagiensis TaxID=346912 RepID=A0ABQ6CGK0_9HYPH|nr:hypothetical protein GCM10007874_08490 [Labrys miyagiensis]